MLDPHPTTRPPLPEHSMPNIVAHRYPCNLVLPSGAGLEAGHGISF